MASLENVSDTALWVAVYRALESERKDALFVDLFAKKLAGRRGLEMVAKMPKGLSGAWTVVARTVVFDRWITRLVKQGKVQNIVNLAAGLDTRPYRLDLPSTLRWLEVDLPELLQAKSQVLKDERSRCELVIRPCDLTDTSQWESLLEEISAFSGRTLLLTEGLLVYLSRSKVENLVESIAQVQGVHYWITDLNSPAAIQQINRKWSKNLVQAGSPMMFAPHEGEGYFLDRGWKILEIEHNTSAAKSLGREMKHAWFWRHIGRRFSADYDRLLKDPTKLLLLSRGLP